MPIYRGTVEVKLADNSSPGLKHVQITGTTIGNALVKLHNTHPEYNTAKEITYTIKEDIAEVIT